MTTIHWERPKGFRLQAAADFYAGFTPGSGMAAADLDSGHLTLAFRLDGTFEAVAVTLREVGARLEGEVTGTVDGAVVKKQVGRMLGLDVDGSKWRALGRADPVVGKLQAEFPGFFTAAKASPYDAAAWGMIAPRMSIQQAARIKRAMAAQFGDTVKGHAVFPSPKQLLQVTAVAGLSEEKLARLKGVAVAALDGKLDADRLRAMPEAQALIELEALRGVGPWTAEHILYRGAALSDALPTSEPRVLHGFADASGLKKGSVEALVERSEGWRPFRMWVCVLLARHLGRIGGWNRPGLAEERGRLGRRAAQ